MDHERFDVRNHVGRDELAPHGQTFPDVPEQLERTIGIEVVQESNHLDDVGLPVSGHLLYDDGTLLDCFNLACNAESFGMFHSVRERLVVDVEQEHADSDALALHARHDLEEADC